MDSNICRTCTEHSNATLVPIFSKLEDQFIANVIVDSCSVTITEDDDLPTNVCAECLKTIQDIIRFGQKVRESDRKLRKFFKGEALAEDGDVDLNESLPEIKIEFVEGEEVEQEVAKQRDALNLDTSDVESEDDFEGDADDSDWKGEEKETEDDESAKEKQGVVTRNRRKVVETGGADKPKVKKKRWNKPTVKPKSSKTRTENGEEDSDSEGEDALDEVERDVFVLLEIDPSRLVCCRCFQHFGTEDELKEHGKQKHSKRRRRKRSTEAIPFKEFQCDVCYVQYTTEEALKYHQDIASQLPTLKIYECKLCLARFHSVKRRRLHAHNHPKHDAEKQGVVARNRRKATETGDADKPKVKKKRWNKPTVKPKSSKMKTEDGEEDSDSEGEDALDEVEQGVFVLLEIDPSRLVCCRCFQHFGTEDELKEHGKQKHSKRRRTRRSTEAIPFKEFQCDVCYVQYTTEEALKYHKDIASQLPTLKIYECKLCLARFHSVKRRRLHAHNHPKYDDVKKEKRPFMCCKASCHKQFETEKELFEHGQRDHITNKRTQMEQGKPHECPVCFKWFETPKSVIRHQRRVYMPNLRLNASQCAICGKKFNSSGVLRKHEQTHLNIRPFACEICGKQFTSTTNLKYHMMVHTAEKSFTCTVCGCNYKRGDSLKKHMETQHSEAQWKCEVCEKTFKGKYYLQYHMRIHTGQKPWPCRYCDMAFACHTNRKRHESSHTGIKPHKCSYCDKTFIIKRFQIEHESTHTGIKPYRCELCDVSFGQKPAFKKHQLEVHQLTPENQPAKAQPTLLPAVEPLSPA